MFTFTTIGLSVSPRRITDSCMGIPSGKSCWPAQSYENRTGRAMSGRRSTPNVWLIFWPRSKRIRHIKVDVATAEHLVEKKRARGKTTTRYPDDPEMRDVYEEELRRLRLRAVLLDEAQHLITSGDGKQPKDQLNWIKSMAIETGVLHVLIGTYDLLPFCNLDG